MARWEVLEAVINWLSWRDIVKKVSVQSSVAGGEGVPFPLVFLENILELRYVGRIAAVGILGRQFILVVPTTFYYHDTNKWVRVPACAITSNPLHRIERTVPVDPL